MSKEISMDDPRVVVGESGNVGRYLGVANCWAAAVYPAHHTFGAESRLTPVHAGQSL